MPLEYAYIGIKQCGCVVRASCYTETDRKQTALDVQQYVLDGLIVERVTIEDARLRLKKCHCKYKYKE